MKYTELKKHISKPYITKGRGSEWNEVYRTQGASCKERRNHQKAVEDKKI